MKPLMLIISAALILIPAILKAQSSEEIQSLKIVIRKSSEISVTDSCSLYKNELALLTGQLFKFYKKRISSQDAADCTFQPSCSEYALLAIKKQGFLVGILNSLDRLTRCSKRNAIYYPLKTQDSLRIDPVRNIKYEEK